MCGIVGYVGDRSCGELLMHGLERLEYRGYDSAGVSLLAEGEIQSVRAVGNLSRLREAVDAGSNGGGTALATGIAEATTGIGHTRWATHGKPSERNAHPHADCSDHVHIVLNGIIENYVELREALEAQGHVFASETDAEAVAHLIEKHLDLLGPGHLPEAVRLAYLELRGHYAFVAIAADEPETIVGARKECPLVVGVGENEHFIASAIPAFLRETRRVQLVNDDEIVTVHKDQAFFRSAGGQEVQREVEKITWDEDAAEKAGYPTFMLKEIHEQSDAVAETIADRLKGDRVDLGDIGIDEDTLAKVRRIVILACGTSYHAALVGRYAIEQWARVPVEMDIASEYRYRNPIVGPDDLVIGISQSGETADTLAAMRLAQSRGARVLAITNILGSQMTRDADGVLYTRAGLEIGVAATKTFVAQVAAIYLLGLKLAELRHTLEPAELDGLVNELKSIPHRIEMLLESCEEQVQEIARSQYEREFFLYLGRHIGLPVCLEGALKLKEISYIPTEAYAAGEMKHGPIALLDSTRPVVCVATDSPVLDKVLSNISEVKARGSEVIAVATEGSGHVAAAADQTIFIPRTDWILQPILAVIPLQLLAYHIAVLRGLNVDQPRNLAKTVTVE
jgi:glucosamine--fructose-6-phosphate aminotransferase (isomerizing)